MTTEGKDAKALPDVDWKDLKTPWIVPIAGGAMGVLGLLSFFAALQQVLIFFPVNKWWLVALVPLLLQALLTSLMAPLVIKARAWASIFGLLLVATSAFTVSGWWIYTLVSPYFGPSLLVLFTALFAWPVLLLVPFSIPSCLRLSRARRALYKS